MSGNPRIPTKNFEYEHCQTFSLSNHAVPFRTAIDLLKFNFTFSPKDEHLNVSCNAPKERIGWKLILRLWVGIKSDKDSGSIVIEHSNVLLSFLEPVFSLELSASENWVYGLPATLEVTVRLSVIEEQGLWPLIKPSVNFLVDHELANAILFVGGEQFFVNLDLLSINSAYFAQKRKELEKDGKVKIDIAGIENKTMRTILRMIYYKQDLITDDNVEKLIPAAKLLKLEFILSKCEHFLLSMTNVERHLTRLQLIAHNNDMSALHDFCHQKLYPTAVSTRPSLIPEVHSEAYSVPDISDYLRFNFTYTLAKRQNFFGQLFSKTEYLPEEVYLVDVLVWNLTVQQTTDDLIVSVSPICAENLKFAMNWSIVVDWIKISMNSDEESARMFQFDASNPKFEARFSIKMIVDLDMEICLQLKVNSIKGLRYFINQVHTLTKGITSDVVLRLSDEVCYANIQILAQYSEYFRLLNKKETLNKEEVANVRIIEEFNHSLKEIHALFFQIYPSNNTIEDTNIGILLKMADKFLCTQVMIDCAKFLMKREDFRLETLQFAVDFHLEPVKDVCLTMVKTPSDLFKTIKADPYWENLSDDTKVVLMDEILNKI